jgi:hypothetical protein
MYSHTNALDLDIYKDINKDTSIDIDTDGNTDTNTDRNSSHTDININKSKKIEKDSYDESSTHEETVPINIVMYFSKINISNIRIGDADPNYQTIPIEYYNETLGKCHPLYIQVS